MYAEVCLNNILNSIRWTHVHLSESELFRYTLHKLHFTQRNMILEKLTKVVFISIIYVYTLLYNYQSYVSRILVVPIYELVFFNNIEKVFHENVYVPANVEN